LKTPFFKSGFLPSGVSRQRVLIKQIPLSSFNITIGNELPSQKFQSIIDSKMPHLEHNANKIGKVPLRNDKKFYKATVKNFCQ